MTKQPWVMALALVCLAGTAAAQQQVNERVATPATGVVEINNIAGSVRVLAWDRNEVQVTGQLGRGVERLDLNASGDRVDVRVVYPRNGRNSSDSDIEVRVPARKDLRVRTVSADVVVEAGRPGQLDVHTVSGDVRLSGDAGRSARAESVSGDLELSIRTPELTAKSVSGDVAVRGGARAVRANAVSGDVRVVGDVERAALETVSGSLHFDGALLGDARLELSSHSGDVELRLPERAGAEVEVRTFSGSISNAFGPAAQREGRYTPGQTLRFTLGQGNRSINVKTFSGDVRLLGR